MDTGRYRSFLIMVAIIGAAAFNKHFQINSLTNLNHGEHLFRALRDIIKGIPATKIAIAFDGSVESAFANSLIQSFTYTESSLQVYNITDVTGQDQFFNYLSWSYKHFHEVNALFFCNPKMAEHVLIEIYENNVIRRNLVFIFYWGKQLMYRHFLRSIHETMRVVVITYPRENAYRVYYSQATSHRRHHLEMVNWWIENRGLFQHPTLPGAKKIFKNFHQRNILIPVLHKPPWHFVQYEVNKTLKVLGGRDDGLIKLLSQRLNFRYEYYDPVERIQGTSFSINGTFEGVLGELWRRESEFFIGDVALTIDRAQVVEFSFFTLADSGAFITHSPNKLNEAYALVRPFHWRVWAPIVITVALSGPILYILISLPNFWQPRFKVRKQKRFLFDISWYTIGIFLKQAGNSPSNSHKARFYIIVLSICATYVIGDMYAANLTSLLARPGREKPITNLHQLAEAMDLKAYKLLVESHSSSFSLLENGTGIYGVLWEIMTKRQKNYLVDTVEQGVKLVRDTTNTVLMAGRETLYFDIQRFGTSKFHLSVKLNTAYSAMALQIGCPYLENFNQILMGIYEAGILTKMTEDEYVNLGKQKSSLEHDSEPNKTTALPNKSAEEQQSTHSGTAKATEEEIVLQPISIKMLQGAFYLLGIGYVFAGIVVSIEVVNFEHDLHHRRTRKIKFAMVKKLMNAFIYTVRKISHFIYRRIRTMINEAIINTFDYIE